MSCTCKVGPGKFEGEGALTFMAWEQAMLGNADISTGSNDNDLVDWLRSPLNLDADQEVVKAALDYGYCQECIDEAGTGVGGGVAVWSDGNGFVYCRSFDTRAEFDEALAKQQEIDEQSVEEGQ